MIEASSPLHVVCRPARERDLEEIKEFCKTIWDGHDYVPDVIDDWFHDLRGILAVADHEGHAIGCSKLTWLAEGQWWLEGFRVDPKYQGRKVGSLLHHYVDKWWLDHGNGVMRLMTSAKNKSVHHLCERTGFTKIFEVRGYKAKPVEGNAGMFTSAAHSDKDFEKVVEFALASPSLSITDHVVDFGWRLADPTCNGAITDLFQPDSSFENNFFWWHKDKGLLIVWDDSDSTAEEYTMGVGMLGCELEDMPAILRDVRHLAAEQGKTSVFWLAPVQEQVELALKHAGYSSDWENAAYVFEKKHPHDPYQSPS